MQRLVDTVPDRMQQSKYLHKSEIKGLRKCLLWYLLTSCHQTKTLKSVEIVFCIYSRVNDHIQLFAGDGDTGRPKNRKQH